MGTGCISKRALRHSAPRGSTPYSRALWEADAAQKAHLKSLRFTRNHVRNPKIRVVRFRPQLFRVDRKLMSPKMSRLTHHQARACQTLSQVMACDGTALQSRASECAVNGAAR